jgi:hypothetical protein
MNASAGITSGDHRSAGASAGGADVVAAHHLWQTFLVWIVFEFCLFGVLVVCVWPHPTGRVVIAGFVPTKFGRLLKGQRGCVMP